MSRDESYMYSGITSATTEPRTAREMVREAKKKALSKLKPGYEFVLDDIANERSLITDISTLIIDRQSTEQEINTELIARKMYLNYLNSLELKIRTIIKGADR